MVFCSVKLIFQGFWRLNVWYVRAHSSVNTHQVCHKCGVSSFTFIIAYFSKMWWSLQAWLQIQAWNWLRNHTKLIKIFITNYMASKKHHTQTLPCLHTHNMPPNFREFGKDKQYPPLAYYGTQQTKRKYSSWLLRLHHWYGPKIQIKIPRSYILVYLKCKNIILR